MKSSSLLRDNGKEGDWCLHPERQEDQLAMEKRKGSKEVLSR